MTTLAEAMSEGQGVERPFRCPVHDDKHASASVNIAKGVWFCYACHASGCVDKKYIPTVEQLESMMEPDKSARRYTESYLELFDSYVYWEQRFPKWLCWYARLGLDPFTGSATFPVRTPNGYLAGLGRRQENTEPRYKYPWGWSASTVLGGNEVVPKMSHLVLVEGYADAVSCWEVGIPALCVYGSGIHYPQLEILFRRAPREVVLGFDMDKAGDLATQRAVSALDGTIEICPRITWPKKDPGDCTPQQRLDAVGSVTGEKYREAWSKWVSGMKAQHHNYVEEST